MTGPVFAQMPVEVFGDARLSARDLRILGLLYAFANREGRCWPSRRQHAALSGLPLARVSTTTTRLAAFGWLTKTGNGGRSRACRYQLQVPQTVLKAVTVAEGQTLTEGVTVAEVVTVTGAVTKTVPGAVTKTVTPVGKRQGTDHEQTREQTLPASASSAAEDAPGYPSRAGETAALERDFACFWSAYPRKRHKGAAWKAWRVLRPDAALVADILQALVLARESADWRREGGRFIPYPATWLNARGWEDEHEVSVAPLMEAPRRQGEAARVAASIASLRTLFGEAHGEHDVSAGDGVSGGGLRDGTVEGAGGGVLGPARRVAR